MLYRIAPLAVLAAFAGGALLCGVLLGNDGPPARARLAWLGVLLMDVVAHLALCRWFAAADRPDAGWRPWARRFVAVSFAEGCTWGAGAVWMSSAGLGERPLVLLTLLLAGVTAGAVVAFGSYLPALYAFVLPMLAPFALYSLAQGGSLQVGLALLYGLFALSVLVLGTYGFNAMVVRSLRARFEVLDLLEELRIEKARSDQASLDKSRFLAASSHDLRQPVHALGLFVAALRACTMDAEARRLVGQIEDCLAGLKGLFDSLLDISRLDAGAVDPRPSDFPLRPLLQRICGDYAGVAAQKGVSMRVVPGAAWVRSDPVLLERILRNVIDNAVRYTEHGRVLVGARRGGAGRGRLRIQVCDTGPGIPSGDQERVFQEFVQLGNPERDRAKGIGLGLAIVRRLAQLLGCELVLRSTPGLGTVFEVIVPTAPAGTELAAAAPSRSLGRLRGTVLIVDDELAVQVAMKGLLTSWGLDVLAAGSGAEMQALAAGLRTPPVLLICDWRLRGCEDGVAVIDSLRAQFNAAIPALLITGDVAPGGDSEARCDIPLLHKPVPPGRLRAMLGSLIGTGEPKALSPAQSVSDQHCSHTVEHEPPERQAGEPGLSTTQRTVAE